MEPWFGPKDRYDLGIASWQGGLATLVFFAAYLSMAWIFRPADLGWPEWSRAAILVSGALCFGILVWAKYDRDPS